MRLSKSSIKINSIELKKPHAKLIRDPILRKNDIYALEFFDRKDNLIYILGIGDPFRIRVQHIGIDDKKHYNNEIPIENFNVIVPSYINPTSVRLTKRDNRNIYKTVAQYYINPNQIY